MDNKLLNLNGKINTQLEQALRYALTDEYGSFQSPSHYELTCDKGLILYWGKSNYAKDNIIKFPFKQSFELTLQFCKAFLSDDDTWSQSTFNQWEKAIDLDGSLSKGFRIYTEDWGQVNNNDYAICAIKPCWLWYGK